MFCGINIGGSITYFLDQTFDGTLAQVVLRHLGYQFRVGVLNINNILGGELSGDFNLRLRLSAKRPFEFSMEG